MSVPSSLALPGFGEAARAFAGSLREDLPGLREMAFDIKLTGPGAAKMRSAMGARGAAYFDKAVMAPVHPRGHRTAALVAGPGVDAVLPTLARLGFSAHRRMALGAPPKWRNARSR